MNALYWDLETEGLPQDKILPLMPEFSAGGNVKDPAKIAAAIEEKKSEWLDKAALKAITGKIVAATFAGNSGEPEMHTGDEADIILVMLGALMGSIGRNENCHAWNGHGFDLPFLCQRAAVHDIKAFGQLTSKFRGRYYWNEYLIDPKLVWSNYSPDHTGTSLKSVSFALGIGEKSGSGKDFAHLLKVYPEKAKEYALQDVRLLRSVVQRMGL